MTATGSTVRPRSGGSAVSRADALRAYLELGPERIGGPARALGFTWIEPKERSSSTTELEAAVVGEPAVAAIPEEPTPEVAAPLAPIIFWRAVAVDRPEPTVEQDRETEARETMIETDVRSSMPPPPAPPIVAEPRLRRRLDAELRSPRSGQAIDVDRLVDRLSRGESVRELPRCSSLHQARLVLILDPSPRLVPFLGDQVTVALGIFRRLGPRRVRRLPPPAAGGVLNPFPRIAADEIVLTISDLGFYGDEADRDRWLRFGRRLRSEGAELRALVPCPAWRWHGPTARVWSAFDWSSPEGVGRTRRPLPLEGSPWEDPAEALLRLLAPAVRVEPGLLRFVRRILGESADLGTEADVWNHPDADGSSSRNLAIDARRLASADEDLTAGLDPSLFAAAGRALVEWHRGRPDLVWAIEVAHLLASGISEEEIDVERVRQAEAVVARAAASAELIESGDRRAREAVIGFWRREAVRLPAGLPEDRRFGDHVARGVRAMREADPEAPLPATVTPAMLVDSEADAPLLRYSVRQVGKQLRIGPVDEAKTGSLLVEIWAREKIAVSDGVHASVERVLLGSIVEVPCPPLDGRFRLVTDVEIVDLEPWTLPAWASSAGRDGYGLWACFEVGGIEHQLRWMPPGRFLMGSPAHEEGRRDDEGPRQEVTLTQGFWLGEVPCIQDLWEAVMEGNPSRLKSSNRPVEQVSWEDCQDFLERLNEQVLGLESRLPTEAQWEYACRAGTETATWAGDLRILGERNAPRLDKVAWYGGNSGKDFELSVGHDTSEWEEQQYESLLAGTREVGLKLPNPWGLYDMLGNVFEWCSDRWDLNSGYSGEPHVDPMGTSGARRVYRGGSWYSFARYVRAACRNAFDPGIRSFYLGFRVSRGPQDREKAESREGSERGPGPPAEGRGERRDRDS